MLRAGNPALLRAAARCAVLALALLTAGPACAETRVYLLRGWFGVFSTGMDAMAEELRAKGIAAEAIAHMDWKATVEKVVRERAAGRSLRLVLVGHSQGANNIIVMARELQPHRISIELLVTLVPFMQDPVPGNVVKAVNYFQAPGWGSPLVAEPGFKGQLANIDIGNDGGTFHINIDKNRRVQAEIVAAIVALSR